MLIYCLYKKSYYDKIQGWSHAHADIQVATFTCIRFFIFICMARNDFIPGETSLAWRLPVSLDDFTVSITTINHCKQSDYGFNFCMAICGRDNDEVWNLGDSNPWNGYTIYGFFGKTLLLLIIAYNWMSIIVYNIVIQLSLAILRNSPEGHHIYWLNAMKPINLPPSLFIVPLYYVIYGRKISENFRSFDITKIKEPH